MSTRSERDKQKPAQEKHQAILSALLKDEDNKYCVDCDAKGPRWASWNLGIFLCIRCAGIHRNLGVHISKVKSVNLDSWTAEQIAMVQEMGNSRARAVYEAELPDNYRRPQTDSGLEAFIRAKYESKKYIAKEWIPPQPKFQPLEDDPPKKEKKRNRPRPSAGVNITMPPSKSASANSKPETRPSIENKPKSEAEPPKSSPEIDLLGLDTPAIASESSNSNDLFGEFMCTPATAPSVNSTETSQPVQNNGLSDISLFGEDGGQGQDKKSTKESILALYGSGTSTGSNQQMFGVPGGMYMAQPPAGHMNMVSGMQNGMMGGVQQGNIGMMGNMQGTAGMQQGMMMGQMGMMAPSGGVNMMGQGQGQANMYNMGQMYNTQQAQYQQVQNQMASMSLNQGGMGGYPQPGAVAAGGATAGSWANQQSGQTLSNNLWQ